MILWRGAVHVLAVIGAVWVAGSIAIWRIGDPYEWAGVERPSC
jgi:uncharacterized membrane protein